MYPLESWPRKIVPQENCSLKNCLPWSFFCDFFLISNLFLWKFCLQVKSIFIQFHFLFTNNNFVILSFSITFRSFAYIFYFHLWHIMFIIRGCLTYNAGTRYLAFEVNCIEASLTLWGSHNTSTTNVTFYSLKKIVDKLLITADPRGKSLLKMYYGGKNAQKKCSRGGPSHLQQIYLYFRSNMVGQIIRTRNLEEFLTVRCC